MYSYAAGCAASYVCSRYLVDPLYYQVASLDQFPRHAVSGFGLTRSFRGKLLSGLHKLAERTEGGLRSRCNFASRPACSEAKHIESMRGWAG